ncbi:hypothetical protein Ddye_019286 [Dipteronia dyeriana]|uniref:Uncharacterized protein n=1 Tax=Dipteronia dyeriana TaxID=168575 RepID=A0AAD9TXY5_9ROSI|nr:hypothetical protein Ddye_019286 [Dipteronia dyeriana]
MREEPRPYSNNFLSVIQMKALIFVNSLNNYSNPLIISPQNYFPSRFPSLYRENNQQLISCIWRAKWLPNPRTSNLSPIRASSSSADSAGYGGWDDLRFSGGGAGASESTRFRNFLVSIGIYDKKHVFTFVLGLVCALAISRVRVSSIIVFPASVLVFSVGFSFGFVRGGCLNASKRRSKEDIFRVYNEKLKSLVDIFYGFDDKVSKLKSDIQGAIDRNIVTVSDLENYYNVMESIKLSASNARDDVKAYIVNVENSDNVLVESNNKSNKKNKEIGEVGFQLLQFIIGGLSRKKVVNSKPNKVKDNVKYGIVKNVVNDQNRGHNLSPREEERFFGSANSSFSHDSSIKATLDQDGDRRMKMDLHEEKMSLGRTGENAKGFIESEEYSYRNNRLQFMNNRVSLDTDRTNGARAWESRNNLLDSMDFRVSWKHMESETSFVQEQVLKKSNGTYRSSNDNDDEIYRSRFREKKVNTERDSCLVDHLSTQGSEAGSSSTSPFADDVVFDRYVTKANDLLKQAKDCIRSSSDQEHAEIILYNSAKLLSKATAMKPMSLLAVGQLGNTYLLHGELKLRISRELRSILSRSDPLSVEKQKRVLKGLDYQLASKEEIATVLVNVCEECEELLVKAGRKYRFALSIDGNDVRALYNWGLALSFRAQLIADIGPEAAFDADKVFLAAIDKFDAMMSKGNVYAPDALFRWGAVLQQRSRLRPSNSKEKVKLLQQAIRLYEDALHMDSDNLQVRDALLSCMSELDYICF